jgi:sulfatase maturation enzyme AslB (radical SAM superfamily)
MKLEDIGFYTLSDERARSVSVCSPLWRCELILTSRCNFKCPYCRGIRHDVDKELTLDEAKHVIDLWVNGNVKNIRLSGGEPTTWPGLLELVEYASVRGIERIALSTNGSASLDLYMKLVKAGVSDFSISLDACCSSTGNIMAGVSGAWSTVTSNIAALSKVVYTTVGVVLTNENISEMRDIIAFADGLGVSDIRIIPAAQYDSRLKDACVSREMLAKFRILNYRVNNIKSGIPVRGIGDANSKRCKIVLDDMAVAGDYHFPCIIFLRERGDPIGTVSGKTIDAIRRERQAWMMANNTAMHPICKNNCLDCIVLFNDKARHDDE